jgi:3-phenylpropionate/cinnamic acid dioxygenase small subunit
VSNRDDPFVETLRVRAVLERYCMLLDSGAVDDLLGLFDDSCVFTMMGRTYEGKTAFASVWSDAHPVERPTTVHALVNPDIQVDGAHATARSNFVLVRRGSDGDTQVAFAGRYIDELRRESGGTWRFTRRRVETLARAAA